MIIQLSQFQIDAELYEGSDAIWQILDPEGNGSISKDDLMNMDEPTLTSLALAFNLPNTLKQKAKEKEKTEL